MCVINRSVYRQFFLAVGRGIEEKKKRGFYGNNYSKNTLEGSSW